MEIAARTGARLVGVDFSAEAVRLARELEHARPDAQERGSHFVVGDLTATGLAPGAAHAAICLDSIQFADTPVAAYAELRRVLVPGGRAVLTCWEPVEQGDERLVERLRRVDLRAGLTAAGFEQVAVVPRPAWRVLERAFWQEAAALDPGDDPALRSFHAEGIRSVATFDLVTRVMASATAPSGG